MSNANIIVDKHWNYFDVIDTMRKDLRVVAALNGIQNGIRSMVKYIYGEFMKVHSSGTKYLSNSSILEHDGGAIIKDKLDLSSDYGRYIKDIISDKNSFIKEELVKVILNLVPKENRVKEKKEFIKSIDKNKLKLPYEPAETHTYAPAFDQHTKVGDNRNIPHLNNAEVTKRILDTLSRLKDLI